jgi:hypothetical protein
MVPAVAVEPSNPAAPAAVAIAGATTAATGAKATAPTTQQVAVLCFLTNFKDELRILLFSVVLAMMAPFVG